MHTRSSQIYRATCIPGHPVQMAGFARVWMYLLTTYSTTPEHRARIIKHRDRVMAACLRAAEPFAASS
ncbi:MAG: hypothetical protein WED00_00095 [Aquisalimonadaceae bacterium]